MCRYSSISGYRTKPHFISGHAQSLEGSSISLEVVEGIDRFAAQPGGHVSEDGYAEEMSERGTWW